jgi:NADH:ubiquinone reductase (non-electrogenic)
VSDFSRVDANQWPWRLVDGLKLRGWLSWFVWRSAYLTSLGSWRNRIQVPLDWIRVFIFGRDVTNF